jgi:hypothetical protein
VVRLAAVAASAAAVALGLLPASGSGAVGIARMQAALEPSPILFGQWLTATLDVLVNTKVADPGTVEPRARFFPFVLVASPRRDERRDAGLVRIRYSYRLACDSLACLTGSKRERKLTFPAALVRYQDREGHARRVTATWPELRLVSRVGSESPFRSLTTTSTLFNLTPLLQLPADVSAPTPTYRFAPTTGSLVLLAAALLALAGALWLMLPIVARWRAKTEAVVQLSPLERALGAVDDTARHEPGSAEHREALALLARELRRAGRTELVQPARRLAWSEQAPTAGASRELVTQVRAGDEGQ